jgi:GntR family transcriptional regulator/MocR family aminotransferase
MLRLDRSSEVSLQAQLRGQLASAIVSGAAPEGARLPSSRSLARTLAVSRNTVSLAYAQLLAEGLVTGRERSGLFVTEKLAARPPGAGPTEMRQPKAGLAWRPRLKARAARPAGFRCPPDWRRYPYPFVDGRFDVSAYPINDWREASRLALGARDVGEWSSDGGEADDAFLIEEIRTKILPRRGIEARPEEILVTQGVQQALYALCELLVDRRTRVAVEEPGYPDLRQMLRRRGAAIIHQPVDAQGLVVDERLAGADLIFVAPSHQFPTSATLSLDRRRALLEFARREDAVIVEDDIDADANYLEPGLPALKAIDGDGRVIYAAGLSRILSPALRLGFVVAAPELLDELRRLRRLLMRHPPMTSQRAAAFFLSLGHHDATLMRLARTFRERRMALRDALNHYLPQFVDVRLSEGGTAVWVQGPPGLDVRRLAHEAARRGVLIEPVDAYFARPGPEASCAFRLGVTSLPLDRIRPGVAVLAEVVRALARGGEERLESASGVRLTGADLKRTMAGATLLYRTVYGEPCTIELAADGTMSGRAGYANEDRDTGRWWVEGDVWWRQWASWAYGEPTGFHTVLDGRTVKWFAADGRLIDSGVLADPAAESGPMEAS